MVPRGYLTVSNTYRNRHQKKENCHTPHLHVVHRQATYRFGRLEPFENPHSRLARKCLKRRGRREQFSGFGKGLFFEQGELTDGERRTNRDQKPRAETGRAAFYSNSDLADRWRCSRGSVYNRPRGERVMDLAAPGRRGHKLIPLETVQKIERPHLRVLR